MVVVGNMSTDNSITASCSVCSYLVVVDSTTEIFDAQAEHQYAHNRTHVLEFDVTDRPGQIESY